MRVLDAVAVATALPWPILIDRLARAFAAGAEVPMRHHHAVPVPGGPEGTLLLMPAWVRGGALGVKVVSVFPGNATRGLASVQGLYLLGDATTGLPRAILDGVALTLRRTAAASALAARHLARADAARLVVVGTGALAPELARAHAVARPITDIAVWGRDTDKARATATRLASAGLPARAVADLGGAVAAADVVTCATLATAPLISGAWLKPGTHVDLVGGFTPHMREADDEAVRCARLFVDTRAGALAEAGDILDPLRRGVITVDDIQADLHDLATGRHTGRRTADEITLFKSVGTALEDLAAAELAVERAVGEGP
jgi:ornithine cyclodeaminase